MDGPGADEGGSAFYHAFALACIKVCVSIDLFVFGDRYRGVAALSEPYTIHLCGGFGINSAT